MVVPELPPDIAELKERVGRFVADEVFPLEETIAAAGEIDFAAVDEVRRKRARGLLDAEHGRRRPEAPA